MMSAMSGSPIWKLIDSSGELHRLQTDQKRGVAVPADLIAAHERIVAANYARLKGTPMMARMNAGALEDYERALSHYPVVGQAELEAAARRVGSVTSTQSKVSAELAFDQFTLSLRVTALIAAAAVVVSWLFRAPLFSLSGIAVQTRNGKRASRARHLARGAVERAPFLVFLPTPFESSRSLILDPWWLTNLTWPLLLGVVVLPWLLGLAGIVLAVARPSRGIPDLIAGTYLVPG